MPLHCIGEPRNISEDDLELCSMWSDIPESLLLQIFSYLEAKSLVSVAQTCKVWWRVAYDESLWKALLWRTWNISGVQLPPGRDSWYLEYRRLCDNCPVVLSEVLTEHSDEVLHVSFSNCGNFFSTTSKDASIKVWQVGYPTTLKHTKDFRELLGWDFTQFSCFNKSDTMLLVSSVKTTDFMDRRGFVAILSLLHNLQILRVVSMDPSQLFGAWLDDNTFLGGYLEISLDRFATTVQIESFQVNNNSPLPNDSTPVIEEGVGQNLFTFSSETASLVKFLTVAGVSNQDLSAAPSAYCMVKDVAMTTEEEESGRVCLDCHTYQNKKQTTPVNTDRSRNSRKTFLKDWNVGTNAKQCKPSVSYVPTLVEDSNVETKAEQCKANVSYVPTFVEDSIVETKAEQCKPSASYASAKVKNCDSSSVVTEDSSVKKNLIFVTGEFAVALHQLGIKNVSTESLTKQTSSINEEPFGMDVSEESHHMVVNFSNNDIHVQPFRKSDKPDHLIDLFGHVTGLCLSRDNRYLYLNYRPWIGKVDRNDPWATPDLSPSIEVLVIDLMNLQNKGVQYVGHKGYSPSTMCCFVFLDVSNDYVGSGSEDARAYLWDKHYRNNLAVYEHSWGVVNAVGFNPANQEYMVTVSDDNTIKIWRSRSEIRKLGPLFDPSYVTPVEADKCVNRVRDCESVPAAQGT